MTWVRSRLKVNRYLHYIIDYKRFAFKYKRKCLTYPFLTPLSMGLNTGVRLYWRSFSQVPVKSSVVRLTVPLTRTSVSSTQNCVEIMTVDSYWLVNWKDPELKKQTLCPDNYRHNEWSVPSPVHTYIREKGRRSRTEFDPLVTPGTSVHEGPSFTITPDFGPVRDILLSPVTLCSSFRNCSTHTSVWWTKGVVGSGPRTVDSKRRA